MKRMCILLGLVWWLLGCFVNSPPMYGRAARQFLLARGVDDSLVTKLTDFQPLTVGEVAALATLEHVAVLHLLGANLSTPHELLAELARHESFEVRTGVASNAMAPLEVLLSLRVAGRYDTVNLALSGNPRLPQKLLREIYASGEAGLLGLASNPNLPEDLMRAIDAQGDWLERATLARNPRLPRDLLESYLVHEVQAIRSNAEINAQIDPRYKKPQDDLLGGP